MNNNSGGNLGNRNRSSERNNNMKIFAASHPLPLSHTLNNNHSNQNLLLNNNNHGNRHNTSSSWDIMHDNNLNNVTQQDFQQQQAPFRTPGQQRTRNNMVGAVGNNGDNDNYDNSRGNKFGSNHSFSKTPFGPSGNNGMNTSGDVGRQMDRLNLKNKPFQRTPGPGSSFSSRGSTPTRAWSSYDGRGQGNHLGGNNIRNNFNQIGIIGGRSSLNDANNSTKRNNVDNNALNRQFMEQSNDNLNRLSSWNNRGSGNNMDSNIKNRNNNNNNNSNNNNATFASTPGTLGSRMRPDNYFPSNTQTTKFTGKRIDNTQSFPPRTPNRNHTQDNVVRQTTPFQFGLGSDSLPTTYASMNNNSSPQSSPANNSMMSRSSDNSMFSRNHRVRDFGGPNDDDGGHPDYGDLLNKKFSTSPIGGNSIDGIGQNMFLQDIDDSNNGLNPNAPVFNYTPPSPSKAERFHGNGGVLNLSNNGNISSSRGSNMHRNQGNGNSDGMGNTDPNLTMADPYGRNGGMVGNDYAPNLNAMYGQQQQQQQQRRRRHQQQQRGGMHQQQHGNSGGGKNLHRQQLSQSQGNNMYNNKRQYGSKMRMNNNGNNSRNNKRGNNKKQGGTMMGSGNGGRGGMMSDDSGVRGKKSHHQGNTSPNQQKHGQQQEKKLNSISRQILKDFYLLFKKKEKEEGPKVAKLLGLKYVGNKNLDVKARAKIYCLLADLEKRDGKFEKAREYFGKVNELDPYAKEGWLEFSKMEEDCGNFDNCRSILQKGLSHDATNENILKSLIKLEEKTGNIDAARDIIAKLDDYPLSNTWKIILESALMEARAGENSEARQIFEMLMEKVPWSSAVYFEAARFEEKHHCDEKAINIVSRGLGQNSRFGPLWFSAFRLHEKIEVKRALNVFDERKLKGRKNVRLSIGLTHTQSVFDKASFDVAKELQWKVSFEKAKMFERAALTFIGHLAQYYNVSSNDTADVLSKFDSVDKNYAESLIEKCRDAYKLSLQQCQKTLHWKVWLAAARMEVWSRNIDAAREFLTLALGEAPLKSKTQVYLETARLEEFEGNVEEARDFLIVGQERSRKEWKIYLESVLLEMRYNKREAAIKQAENALNSHPGTGRLWAILIQLKSVEGPKSQFSALERALGKVPKSGEVWCEAARLALNPTSPFFNLEKARLFLDYAIQFTPQYGDSFLEYIRYILIIHVHDKLLNFLQSKINFIEENLNPNAISSDYLTLFSKKLNYEKISLKSLNQQCINADPNYGVLWFHCKNHPFDTAQIVFQCAKKYLGNELNSLTILQTYCNAFVRTWRSKIGNNKDKISAFGDVILSTNKYSLISGTNFKKDWRQKIVYMEGEIGDDDNKIGGGDNNKDSIQKRTFLTPGGSYLDDYATGLVEVNRLYYTLSNEAYTKDQRRKLIYGSDQILV